MNQLVNYMATYTDDGMTLQSISIILLSQSDAAYLNVSMACSRAGTHIMISEDAPVSRYNAPLLTIAKIIKCVMSSASESELTYL